MLPQVSITQSYFFFSAMLSVEEGSGDAEMLSEEEGLPCWTWNDCCTNGLKIKSVSIQSELVKAEGETQTQNTS